MSRATPPRPSPRNSLFPALVAFVTVGLVTGGALFTFHPGLGRDAGDEAQPPAADAGAAGNATEAENATRPAPRPHWQAPVALAAGLGLLAGGATYALVRLAARLPRNGGG